MTVAQKSTLGLRKGTTDVQAVVERLRSRTAGEVRTVGGASAATVVCMLAAVRIGLNAPLGQSPAGLQFAHTVASTAAILVPGGVAIAAGAVADAEWVLVGLVAAGVFSLLAVLMPAAGLPALGVLSIAAFLVMAPTLAGNEQRTGGRSLFAGLVVAAVVLSLGANAGVLASGARSLGTTAALVALVVAPVAIGASRRALLVGASAAVFVAAGAVAAPFVTGAVFLAVGAAIDPTVVVAAAGIGGGVALVTEGTHRRQVPVVAGGLLLLTAGIPATVPRGLAVVLGAHLVLVATGASASGATSGGDPS